MAHTCEREEDQVLRTWAANRDHTLLHLCRNYTLFFPSGTKIQSIPKVSMICTHLAAEHASSPPLPTVSQLAVASVYLFPRNKIEEVAN